MSPTIYLTRHGETEWNRAGRFQGQQDLCLNQTGLDQAQQLATWAESVGISRIYSSPLQRALQTANAVGQLTGVEVNVDARLAECSFGHCEGLTRDEMELRFPNLHADREREPFAFRWPNGERLQDVIDRASGFAREKLLDLNSLDKNILIVGHETFNRALMSVLLATTPATTIRIKHPHAIVYRLTTDDSVEYLRLGDIEGGWRSGFISKE